MEPNSDDLGEDTEHQEDNKNFDTKNDRKPHQISHDVREGKTIFIKNVPFSATNEDLKQCMLQFGPVYYALICMDKLTEHSKGTGFVKFVNKEDSEKALSAGTELKLQENILDCYPALERNEVQKKAFKKEEDKKEYKDSRNLYLVKEGVILAGSKAAFGVSSTDMAKRLQIEQYKTQMLRNLNMFVSKERLVMHNLPSSWDDRKLCLLFQKYAGEGAVIKEAKVMRDMKNLDSNGIGKSKEYGFVAFTKHEYALKALRSLNNNPNVFTSYKRPIINFSIESKIMLNARKRRLEKSKMRNPTNKSYVTRDEETENNSSGKKKWKKRKINKQSGESPRPSDFSGVSSEPGKKQKMRSKYKLTTQAKVHYENLKKEKRRRKNAKKSLLKKKNEFRKQPKQKINKRSNENDTFSKIEIKYKKALNAPIVEKAKWYE